VTLRARAISATSALPSFSDFAFAADLRLNARMGVLYRSLSSASSPRRPQTPACDVRRLVGLDS